jgi:hypothetical protein
VGGYPVVILGLLVDRNGYPLSLHSIERNQVETKIILPVRKAFLTQNGRTKAKIVTDAGLLSMYNLAAFTEAGYTYIVGSWLYKAPYDIAANQKTGELRDPHQADCENLQPDTIRHCDHQWKRSLG